MRKPAMFFRSAATALSGFVLLLSHPAASAREARPKSAPVTRAPYVTEAPVVMLKDLDSGRILFSRGADKRFAPASMAKVMTAYVVVDLIEKRSEEHTSELQSLMRISYAVFCLK